MKGRGILNLFSSVLKNDNRKEKVMEWLKVQSDEMKLRANTK